MYSFPDEDEMPLDIVQHLIQDCSDIDLAKIREGHVESKKKRS
jgi:hypothetical protein